MWPCPHDLDSDLCADSAVESGEWRWTSAGELERTVAHLIAHPDEPLAREVYELHNERGYCGCDSCEAHARTR